MRQHTVGSGARVMHRSSHSTYAPDGYRVRTPSTARSLLLSSGELRSQPSGMAGCSHLLERAPRVAQKTCTVASIAEIQSEARAFLDHERRLSACAGLGDERLGTRQARLDCRLRGDAVEPAQHPRLGELRAYLPAACTAVLRHPDRAISGSARDLGVAHSEPRLG